MGRVKRTLEEIEYDIKCQHKTCCVCEERKPFDEFYSLKSQIDGKSYRCKLCDGKARKKWAENNPERSSYSSRNRRLKHVYGVDIEWYENQMEKQNHCCAICGVHENSTTGERKDWNFAVDHCHLTGAVRGLLCNKCNRALGMLNDSEKLLNNAIKYLQQYDTHSDIDVL